MNHAQLPRTLREGVIGGGRHKYLFVVLGIYTIWISHIPFRCLNDLFTQSWVCRLLCSAMYVLALMDLSIVHRRRRLSFKWVLERMIG